MEKLGFVYRPDDTSVDSTAPPVVYDPNWGPLDPAFAARNGYTPSNIIVTTGPDGQPTMVPSGVDMQHTESAADQAYNDALLGVNNDGGCWAQAYQQLGPADPGGVSAAQETAAQQAVDNAQSQADSAALLDPRVTGAVQAWSACMKQQGYSYKTPQEAMSDSWGLIPDQKELKTAQADAQCKVQVNLMGTIDQVTFDYEQKAVNANLPSVQLLHQMHMATLANAEAVLAQQPK